MADAEPEQPEWLVAWKNDPRTPEPHKPGNPNWYKGMPVSPNPKGRPPGQTKASKLMQRMLEDAGDVVDAVIAKAKEGDSASAGLVLSRILPALRSQSEKVLFDFDPTAPVGRQIEQVLDAIATGSVAPDTGKQIIEAVTALNEVRKTEHLAARIEALEGKAA